MYEERVFTIYKHDYIIIDQMKEYFERHFFDWSIFVYNDSYEFTISIDVLNKKEIFALKAIHLFFKTTLDNLNARKEIELINDYKEMMR